MGFYEDILNSLSEAVFVLDPEMGIRYCNRAAEENLHLSDRAVPGRDIFLVLPWLTDVRATVEKASRSGRSCFLGILHTPDGPVRARFAPLERGDASEGWILTVDPGPRTPEERNALAFESLDGLISQMAHEIQNPLGGIRGASQLLQEKLPDDYGEYLGVICKEVDRLSGILRELIDYASPARPVRASVNVHEILDRAVDLLNPRRVGVRVERTYDPSLPEVRGESGKLLQVFINILKNALEALGPAGDDRVIWLRTRPSPQYVEREGRIQRWAEVSFRDNGSGIPPEDLDRIFLPYQSRKRGGNGLGLAICRKILQGHGGMIRVESEPGSGSTFHVYIPFS